MSEIQNHMPSEYSPYFWDVHIEELDLSLHSRFIIARLLNEGDHHTLQWIFNTYSIEEIRTGKLNSRNLSRKTARYWQYYFNLQEEDMQCFGALLTKTDNLF